MTMLRRMSRWGISVAIGLLLAQPGYAQVQIRRGVLLYSQVRMLAAQSSTVSFGRLADLRTDRNFSGNFQQIVDASENILNGYTVVRRGGFFPENQGIPRDRQLAVVEAVYQIYTLPNGNELFLFRTPTQNTAQYFIRRRY